MPLKRFVLYAGDVEKKIPHPAFQVFCWNPRANNGLGAELTDGTWSFGWGAFCPRGTLIYEGQAYVSPAYCVEAAEKPQVCPCPTMEGNPIDVARKEKIQVESDLTGTNQLRFERYYSSVSASGFGVEAMASNWRHTYSKRLVGFRMPYKPLKGQLEAGKFFPTSASGFVVRNDNKAWPYILTAPEQTGKIFYAVRPNGYSYFFETSDNGLSWRGDVDTNVRLLTLLDASNRPSQFHLVLPSKDIEVYDTVGKLLEIRFANGYSQMMVYANSEQPDTLTSVSDSWGRQIRFEYDNAGHLVKMFDPANQLYQYDYDVNSHNLISVKYPDGLKRLYSYGNPAFPVTASRYEKHLLTGIDNETSPGVFVRFATFTYDPNTLLPIATEHAGGVERITVADNVVTNTNALRTIFGLTNVQGMPRLTYRGKTNASGTVNISESWTHDTYGNIVSYVDYRSVRTNFTYDVSRGLEISKTEGVGTPQARTISTQWHTAYRIPVQIDEPLRRTTFTHDANGNVLTKTEQATTDTNGSQGAAATVVGAAKVWTYTYNNFGQVLTAKGPRTDINDLTSYVYDNQGNLTSVTNPAGHVTSMSNYDAHGRVGLITDPNGVTTALTYHPRGWLLSRAVTADGVTETTSYTYDGVGQMTQVTLPDNSVITYTYDDAHRLTKVSDHLGNSITYTLDNMGNRVKEEVKDASGTLTQQVTRVYDILNRLKEVTGGMQ